MTPEAKVDLTSENNLFLTPEEFGRRGHLCLGFPPMLEVPEWLRIDNCGSSALVALNLNYVIKPVAIIS